MGPPFARTLLILSAQGGQDRFVAQAFTPLREGNQHLQE